MRQILLATVLATLTGIANSSPLDAGFLLRMCKEPQMRDACETYLMGSIQGILEAEKMNTSPFICPQGKSLGVLMSTALQDISTAQDTHKLSAVEVIYSSLKLNFPCK